MKRDMRSETTLQSNAEVAEIVNASLPGRW